MATTPDEFLQFAKDMGLNQMKPTSNSNNGYSVTGLSVLNNLCHLIEHIHILKVENDRLHANLQLMNQKGKFLSRNEENSKTINQREKKMVQSTELVHDGQGDFSEEKSSTLSPSNSLKIIEKSSSTASTSGKERQGTLIR